MNVALDSPEWDHGAVFAAYYLAWRVVDSAATALVRRTKLDKTAHAFLASVLRYGLLTLGVVNASL